VYKKCIIYYSIACSHFSFAEKKSVQKKAAGKNEAFFPGWCCYGLQYYCSAGLIGSDAFYFLTSVVVMVGC